MFRLKFLSVVVLAGVSLLFCRPGFAEETAKSEIRLGVVDTIGLEFLRSDASKFEKILSERAKISVKVFPITGDSDSSEAFKSQHADFIFCGPAEYVLLKKKATATPVLSLYRPDNFAALVVLSGIGLYTPRDLRGKRIAFGDVGSTLFHLAPLQLLKEFSVSPNDIKQIYSSRTVAWEALKNGEVDAIATSNERLQVFLNRERQLKPTNFRVIARGGDLPGDVILARPKLDPKTIEAFKKAFVDNSGALVRAMMGEPEDTKPSGMRFTDKIIDIEYNSVRQMYRTAGFPEFTDAVNAG